jgi:hypothetical protein
LLRMQSAINDQGEASQEDRINDKLSWSTFHGDLRCISKSLANAN